MALAGCGGGSNGPDPTCDVEEVFATKCGSGGICHSSEGREAGLDLVSPGVENRLSFAAGNQCSGILANPADPESSLLYQKIAGVPACGSRMPLFAEPLSDAEITCVRDWISGLLPPQNDAGSECPDCVCEPGQLESCYTGPERTRGIGACQDGMARCAPDGSGLGACMEEVTPRPDSCNTAIDENCDGETVTCGLQWAHGIGVPGSQSVRAVAVDADGNVFVAGDFSGTVSWGGEPLVSDGENSDIALAKFDEFGNHVWSKRFGDTSTQVSAQLAVDAAGNVLLLARAFGKVDFGGGELDGPGTDDIDVAKFDTDGNHIWSRVFGGIDPDRAERIAIDPAGDVLITGTFTGTANFGSGPFTSAGFRDVFVAKLDGTSGQTVIALPFGGAGDDYGFGIDADAAGNIYLTGRFGDTIDLGGQTLTTAGDTDVFVAKLTGVGAHVWSRRVGGTGPDVAFDLAYDAGNDRVAITGYFTETVNFGGGAIASAGSRDIFVAVYDAANGGHVLSRGFGDGEDQFDLGALTSDINTWSAMTIDAGGNIYVAGPFSGSANFGGPVLSASGTDAYFFKLNSEGTFLAGQRFGRAGTELALDIAVRPSGHILMAGRMFGSGINFGAAGEIIAAGNSDGFIVQMLP